MISGGYSSIAMHGVLGASRGISVALCFRIHDMLIDDGGYKLSLIET
jgi:hypothetical protein